jgi:hypothetical protein
VHIHPFAHEAHNNHKADESDEDESYNLFNIFIHAKPFISCQAIHILVAESLHPCQNPRNTNEGEPA